MPARPRPHWQSRFSTTFVIGTSAALWFAAALVTGERIAVYSAAGWLVILVLDLGLALRR